MTHTIPVELNGFELEVEPFRSVHILENFSAYATRFLLPVYTDYMPEAADVHCILSGYPIYRLVESELELMIHSAVIALKFDRFDRVLDMSESDTASAFEMLWDHLTAQIINLNRKAPSISYSKDRLVIGYMPMSRQLSILINTLLFSAGMYKNRSMSYDDIYARNVAAMDVAASLDALDSLEPLHELHAALIELDAKYAIKNLVFIRRETEQLAKLREELDFDSMLQFVLRLIEYRDRTMGDIVESGQLLWTSRVFSDTQFNAVDRRDYSNIFKPEPAKPVKVAAKRGRPRKVKSESELAVEAKKAAIKSTMSDAFDAIFAKKD